MTTTARNRYRNTDRWRVMSFLKSMSPTEFEATHIAYIFEKSSLSMRDFKKICEFIAVRVEKTPLSHESLDALGISQPPEPEKSTPARTDERAA